MNDYQKEIADLEAQIDQLVEAEGDPKTIAELSMQLEILKAIYSRATDLLERGKKDQGLRYGLRIQGYGDWTLDNVYACSTHNLKAWKPLSRPWSSPAARGSCTETGRPSSTATFV